MVSCCALIGNPVAHSLSPLIHQYFANQAGKELIYEKIQGNDLDFESQVMHFFKEGGKGLNITLPFKQRAFAMANQVTSRCLKAKAANTLWVQDRQLWADNTDGVGFIKDVSRYTNLVDKNVLLIGAGGAARGIIDPLLGSTLAKLTLVNRTKEKLLALLDDFPEVELAELSMLTAEFNLIINATSTSLDDNQALFLPAKILQNKPCCYDLTYNLQKPTPFIDFARKHNCMAYDGLGMLVEQAAEAFLIWHGFKPNTEIVLTHLKN